MAHGRIFRRDGTGPSRSASAAISIVRAIWSSGSSTRSNNVGGSQRATTSSRRTTSRSPSSRQSGFGSALMSPRPKRTERRVRARNENGRLARAGHNFKFRRGTRGLGLTKAAGPIPQKRGRGSVALSRRRALAASHMPGNAATKPAVQRDRCAPAPHRPARARHRPAPDARSQRHRR